MALNTVYMGGCTTFVRFYSSAPYNKFYYILRIRTAMLYDLEQMERHFMIWGNVSVCLAWAKNENSLKHFLLFTHTHPRKFAIQGAKWIAPKQNKKICER